MGLDVTLKISRGFVFLDKTIWEFVYFSPTINQSLVHVIQKKNIYIRYIFKYLLRNIYFLNIIEKVHCNQIIICLKYIKLDDLRRV